MLPKQCPHKTPMVDTVKIVPIPKITHTAPVTVMFGVGSYIATSWHCPDVSMIQISISFMDVDQLEQYMSLTSQRYLSPTSPFHHSGVLHSA